MSEKELLQSIMALDLNPIIYSLVKRDDGPRWSIEKAKEIEIWYRRFLFLTCMHPEEAIVPTKEIDEFWHTHILDTKKYFSDCQEICGEYIHHFPYLGTRGREDKNSLDQSFLSSLALYERYFNSIPTDASLHHSSSICSVCSSCSSHIETKTKSAMDFRERPSLSH